jgi:hypothetical protein
LFSQIVGVDPKLHRGLRLDRRPGYRFSGTTQFVPLGLDEFEVAAHDYPILFTADARPIPIALLGLQQNLFVEADGSWKPKTYVPAYLRAFPFVFIGSETSRNLYLAMDPGAPALSRTNGEPLFEGDEPSATLKEAMALAAALRNSLVAAEEMAKTLDQAGGKNARSGRLARTRGSQDRFRRRRQRSCARIQSAETRAAGEGERRHLP